MKKAIEKIQLYDGNEYNKGELVHMSDGWEWLCPCGHHRYNATTLREIIKLLDKENIHLLKLKE